MHEFEKIRRLTEIVPCATGVSGPGDDAALLRQGGVVTTDTMVEEVHFRSDWSSWNDVGYKLVASNVSDILAMGAQAETAFLNLSLAQGFEDETFEELCRGIATGIGEWAPRLLVAGGDITSTPSKSVLSMTVVGRPIGRRYWSREGARSGMALFVDGALGLAAAGVEILQNPRGERASRDAANACVRAHRRPVPPRWAIDARLLKEEPFASIDVSDGLAGDLSHVLTASGQLGAAIEVMTLPGRSTLAELFDSREIMELQLGGGDDYVRLVASEVSPGPGWTRVGEVRERPGIVVVDEHGAESAIRTGFGYVHR